MGCKYSCEMLNAYGREPADISVPSPDAPNPAAVHLQDLLNGTARRSPPCLLHMAARRPPSRIPGAAARRPALQKPPQHGAARKSQRSPDCATPPKRARVHASSHPSLSTAASPPASDLSLSPNLRRSAGLAAKCVPVPQSCSPKCHPVLLPRRKRPLVRPVYPPLKRLRLDAGDALQVLAQASVLSRLARPALHFVAVSSSACIWLMSGWCTTLMAGVADCYFAQGLPWLIPVMPRDEVSHSFIHSFISKKFCSCLLVVASHCL